MGWAQQISSFLAMAVHSRSDHMPSLPGDKLERAGSSPKSPALGVSVAVHSLSDHMPLLPGDNGHQVPPIHILRQAARQESSSSIGSSRGPSQVVSGLNLQLPCTSRPTHLRLCICCVSMYATLLHACFITRAIRLLVSFMMVEHAGWRPIPPFACVLPVYSLFLLDDR